MQRYAEIRDGVVVSFPSVVNGFTFEQCYSAAFREHCVECSGDVQLGWAWDGNAFAPPPAPEPEPTLEELRLSKIEAINAGYDSVMDYIQAGYPLKEVLSWELQSSQARELQADPAAEALFVRALAATKGVAVDEMSRRILDNAESWEPIAAMLTAQRQLMEEAAYKAESAEQLAAIQVKYSV